MKIVLLLSIVYAGVGKANERYQENTSEEACGYAPSDSDQCFDSNEECRSFALLGECLLKPEWMKENCPQSCGFCISEDTMDEDCEDLHGNCSEWASNNECFLNPAFMSRSCRKSCWLCVNRTNLLQENFSEEEIHRRWLYSQTDFGLWQSIPKDNSEEVRNKIIEMGHYSLQLEKLGRGILCNNAHQECAQWAVQFDGCETNLDFMITHCSLTCQFCDIVEKYHSCKRKETEFILPVHWSLDSIAGTLFVDHKAGNPLNSRSNLILEDGEWIASLNYTALWSNPQSSLNSLITRLNDVSTTGLVWKDAHTDRLATMKGKTVKRSGMVAFCETSCQEDTSNMCASLLDDIAALLKVEKTHFEPLEFVHYKRGERFSVHHDFRIHDQWLHSGSRILTVFIALQQPEEGGSVGFPEYDWLQVRAPQILVWPNVVSSDKESVAALSRMKNEQLPVVFGELYGVYARLRQYRYDNTDPCA